MDPNLTTLMQNLISAAVLMVVGLLGFAARGLITVGITYLTQKLGQTNYALLQGAAQTVVSFLNQSPAFKDLLNEDKKQAAILQVTNFAKEHNLPIDHELIDKLIEQAVLELKKDFTLVTEVEKAA